MRRIVAAADASEAALLMHSEMSRSFQFLCYVFPSSASMESNLLALICTSVSVFSRELWRVKLGVSDGQAKSVSPKALRRARQVDAPSLKIVEVFSTSWSGV